LISLIQLGTVDYATGLRLQQQLVALRKEEKIGDVLLLLEHKPVITLGRNAKAANVVASPELLKKRGVELFECDRGGDVTFHGPGQIVGYPIFDLRGFARVGADAEACPERAQRAEWVRPGESQTRPSLRKTLGVIEFVRRLEEVLMRTCADFTIATKRVAGLTGVWTDPKAISAHVGTAAPGCPVERSSTELARVGPGLRPGQGESKTRLATESPAREDAESKLAAIGVHVSRFVTSHGFALNVNTDLTYFNLIVPCGITSKPVTSMRQQLGRPLDLNAVAESISRNFGVVFQSQILWVETLDTLLDRVLEGTPTR